MVKNTIALSFSEAGKWAQSGSVGVSAGIWCDVCSWTAVSLWCTLRTKADCGWHESDRPAPDFKQDVGDGITLPLLYPPHTSCLYLSELISIFFSFRSTSWPESLLFYSALKAAWALTKPEITCRSPRAVLWRPGVTVALLSGPWGSEHPAWRD